MDQNYVISKWAKDLHYAIVEKNHQMVNLLLKVYKRTFRYGHEGNTILHHLAGTDYIEIVIRLIKLRGWDVNIRNHRGITPLAFAIENNNANLVKVFINAGAYLGLQTFNGNNVMYGALHMAVRNQNICIIRALLEAECDPNAVTLNNYFTSLHYACDEYRKRGSSSYNIVKMLIDAGADVHAKTLLGNTPLYFSILKKQSLHTIKLLLDHGAEVDVICEAGQTPLEFASRYSSKDAFLLLCQYSMDKADSKGRTALHYAALSLRFKAMKYLVESGADVNALDNDGLDPLCACLAKIPHYNRKYDYIEAKKLIRCVKYLVDYGAKVNREDRDNSPLYIVLKKKPVVKIIHFLLENNADINYDDKIISDLLQEQSAVSRLLVCHAVFLQSQKKNYKVLNFNPDKLNDSMKSFHLDCKLKLQNHKENAMNGLSYLLRMNPMAYPEIFSNIYSHIYIRDVLALEKISRM